MSLLFLRSYFGVWRLAVANAVASFCTPELRSQIDRLICILPGDSRFCTCAYLIKVALEFVPVFLPVDSEFLQERTPVRGMPVELHNAERMSTHGERRDLCIGQHRHTHFTVMCLCGKLTLIQRGHTTCIVSYCYVRVGFIDHGLYFSKYSIRT